MKFSERIGLTPIKTELEREGLSKELRNSLWSTFLVQIVDAKHNDPIYNIKYSIRAKFFRNLWLYFYKSPIDTLYLPQGCVGDDTMQYVRDWYFKSEWYLVFDFIEFCANEEDDFQIDLHLNFQNSCNYFFKQEKSAYRFIDGTLIEINSKEEVLEIDSAIKNVEKFTPVKLHLKRALELYSDRKNPDYRNSIKESISAVESLACIIVDDNKITLGQALKQIEKTHEIPSSLKTAFTAMYGYASHEGGIRHAILKDTVKIEIEEARFMLVACSAFVNYLISKM